jgi:hypothetical protein
MPKPTKQTKEQFINFLQGTLIPDLRESDSDSSMAETLEKAVAFMRDVEVTGVTDRILADTLVSAMEGGVGYWCQITGYKKPKGKLFVWDEKEKDEPIYKHVHYPMTPGGVMKLKLVEGPTKIKGKEVSNVEVTYEKLKEGARVMATKYPRHFANMVGDNGDAETGDVLVQCAVFGEVVFG